MQFLFLKYREIFKYQRWYIIKILVKFENFHVMNLEKSRITPEKLDFK